MMSRKANELFLVLVRQIIEDDPFIGPMFDSLPWSLQQIAKGVQVTIECRGDAFDDGYNPTLHAELLEISDIMWAHVGQQQLCFSVICGTIVGEICS